MNTYAVRRAPRGSRIKQVLKVVIGSLVLAGLGVGTWWVLTSPTFAVARVESGAYRFTSQVELEASFEQFLGRNIWTLSPDEIATRLEVLPWVRDMRVGRSLPNTIEVDFREWRPLWQVSEIRGVESGSSGSQVMIEDGRILEFPSHVVMAGLPVLVGVPAVREGEPPVLRVEPGHMNEIMELISAMEDAGLESVTPIDFIVARDEGYAIVLQDKQGILMVGREEFLDRLNRFMTARDHLEPGLEIDLRFKDRLTVKESPALAGD